MIWLKCEDKSLHYTKRRYKMMSKSLKELRIMAKDIKMTELEITEDSVGASCTVEHSQMLWAVEKGARVLRAAKNKK